MLLFPQQKAWWWPHSTQRPQAWWPIRSPRKWFRGASREEPRSQRRCIMNRKMSGKSSQTNSQRFQHGGESITHSQLVQIMFLYVCLWDSVTKKMFQAKGKEAALLYFYKPRQLFLHIYTGPHCCFWCISFQQITSLPVSTNLLKRSGAFNQ